jgi:hypothetical protein
MKRLLRVLTASLVLFLALESLGYAAITRDGKETPKIGSSVNLPDQKIVWHQDNNYVIEVSGKDFLVKADADNHAIVVKRIHNLASFINDPEPVIASVQPAVYAGLSFSPWGYDPFFYPRPVGIYPRVIVHPRIGHYGHPRR